MNQGKTAALEIEAQEIINWINIMLMVSMSILLTVWLSKDIIIPLETKLYYFTVPLIFFLFIVITILESRLNRIKEQMEQ